MSRTHLRPTTSLPLLLLATAILVTLLHRLDLPAAFLLGSMGAAILAASRGGAPRLPGSALALAQAVVGCLIARAFTPALLRVVGQHFALFLVVIFSVLFVATSLGVMLTRLRVLPGTTALWGSFPGAATVMVLLSDSFGADMRLVALMQYLRVVVVAATASLVARIYGLGSSGMPHPAWLAPVEWSWFAMQLLVIAIGGLGGRWLRLPAGSLLLPMVLTTLLSDFSCFKITLPQPLLAASYIVVGWGIGLRFTADVFHEAARALPRVLASIVTLVGVCATIGWALARVVHLDGLTAYLATSPGGADSVAIIAAGTPVDVPLVMAVQMGRFVSVLLLGPALARSAAKLTGAGSRHDP